MSESCKKQQTMFDGKNMWEELKKEGYCLVKSVIPRSKCAELTEEFFDYLEELQPLFKRGDRSTWTNEILIQHHNIGLQAHAVHTRTVCKPVFEALYPGAELTCSYDGTCFASQPKVFKFKDQDDWVKKTRAKESIHIDQTTEGLMCVQGGVALVDQSIDCKVFMVIPGSQNFHTEIMEINQRARLTEKNKIQEQVDQGLTDAKKLKIFPKEIPLWYRDNWLIMNDEMKDFLDSRGLKRKRVAMEAGDMVLWDSRCCHYSADFTKKSPAGEFRLQSFVCFAPRIQNDEMYEQEIEKRIKAFYEGRSSSHWASTLYLVGKNPHTRTQTQKDALNKLTKVKSYAGMTEEEKKFHGLIRY